MPRGAIGRLRQLIVVTVGVMFIAGAWLARARSTSWEETLWVTVYPIAADAAPKWVTGFLIFMVVFYAISALVMTIKLVRRRMVHRPNGV